MVMIDNIMLNGSASDSSARYISLVIASVNDEHLGMPTPLLQKTEESSEDIAQNLSKPQPESANS